MPYTPPINYAKVDPGRAKRIAAAYEAMPHDPHHPLTHAAYDAMVRETMDQYVAAKRAGFRAEFWPKDNEDPYGPSPRLAIEDINKNNHMHVYPTRLGYGQRGITPEDIADNPLLQDSGERWNGHPVTVNDIFRATHDYFGHAKEGVGFRHDGEENAWRAHAAMYSPLARIAMTNETRGQNSWVNFGPHGEHNQTARGDDTTFAPQKIGHLPPWAVHEGAEDFMPPEDRARVEAAYKLLPRRRRAGGGQIEPQIAPSDLFDMSLLHETPNVPQFDLPRYEPPRGAPARVADLMTNKAVRAKMAERIHRGRLVGSIWYNAEPLRQEFVKAHGEDTGNRIFRRYMDYVAATSPQSDIGTNARNASYYLHRDLTDQGMPTGEKVFHSGTKKLPNPYGHKAQDLHIRNARRIYEEGGWDPLENPKPRSFVENLVGNQQPGTIDTHAMKLPAMLAKDPRFLLTSWRPDTDAETKHKTPARNLQAEVESGATPMSEAVRRAAYWEAKPRKTEYGAMERYYQRLGQEHGLSPAQTQASAWVGGGDLTGLKSVPNMPFMTALNDRVMRTAQARNMDPRDVTHQFVRGQAPLLATGGRAAPTYPMAPRDQWYGDANYAQTGGKLTSMSPDQFLDQVRPLEIDEASRDNIDDLKNHIQAGRRLDPLQIAANGKEDGRHRAHAAKELGIKRVPVLTWPREKRAKGGPVDPDLEAARRQGADTTSIPAIRQAGALDRFHKTLMGAAHENAKAAAARGRDYHERGLLPFPVGTRFTSEHSRRTGQAPWTVTHHFVDPKDEQRYGYGVQRGDEENRERSLMMVSDPAADQRLAKLGHTRDLAALTAGLQPFGGPSVVKHHGGRAGRAEGGGFPHAPKPHLFHSNLGHHHLHVGPIHSAVHGRTDHLPMHVPSGSYVMPADVVSAHGEGNTMAGFKVMRRTFGGMPYGGHGGGPYGKGGGPYDEPLSRGGRAEDGGGDQGVPIVAAGGEYVLSPAQVRAVGNGDADLGTKVLDEFVKRSRARNIKTLQHLPGPAKD